MSLLYLAIVCMLHASCLQMGCGSGHQVTAAVCLRLLLTVVILVGFWNVLLL